MRPSSVLLLAGLTALVGCAEQGPTWEEVAPLIGEHCLSCHETGGIAGVPLDSYENVTAIQGLVIEAVESGTMPPWKPDQQCGDYENAPTFGAIERDLLRDWVDSGARQGEAEATTPVFEREVRHLSRIDATLEMSQEYTRDVSVDDDYRCFPIAWPYEETMYVTGVEVDPGSPDVHHVVAFMMEPGTQEAFLAEDGADGKPGYECFGGPGVVPIEQASWLAGWAPGGAGGDHPQDIGLEVEPGSTVVMQVHYHPNSDEPVPDLTRINLRVESEVERVGWIQPYANPYWIDSMAMRIDAGTTGVEHGFSYPFSRDIDIFTANLHMHRMGRSASLAIERTTGETDCLLSISDWDFDWQRSYVLQESVRLNEGDKLSLSCTWDNVTDEDVFWGEGTGDEMCLGVMMMSLPQ